ncbi:sensor histidine kinase [Actinoplanes sp. NPDC051861]|uniref:sensor histidine kinase n=1 Tax=Actinoplanes sp. NPDC051861 TaxID=3155170 RepID=UPI00341FB0BE
MEPDTGIRVFWASHPHLATVIVVAVSLAAGLDFDMLTGDMTRAGWWAVAVNTVISLALIWRRSWPWAVLAVTVTGDVLSGDTQLIAFAVVMYSLVVHRSLQAATIGAVLSVAVLGVDTFLDEGRYGLGPFIGLYGLAVIISVLVGATVATRRRHVRSLEDRAARLAREKEQEGKLAAARERVRIAHDMHDIVAHNLTIMVRLADGATAVAETDPERSRKAVQRVAALGREAMTDMRRLLGVLRDDSPDTPGDLESLIETFRIAGLPVTLRRHGPDPSSPGLQRVVFRVVQESLTNALRYADRPTDVLVDLDYGDDPIRIVVSDDGRGTTPAPSVGSEQGLNAMRERVAMYGGTVEAGRQVVGWTVRVTLPHPAEGADV